MNTKVIVGIPGPWESREEIVTQIAGTCGPRFLFAGTLLYDSEDKDHVEMEIYEYDEILENAFRTAGKGKISQEVMKQIDSHKHMIYLLFDRENPGLRSHLLKFTKVIRDIGGIAVKVETSGVAHEFEKWNELLSDTGTFSLYTALVTLVGDDEYYFSCGMHNFGLPDCCISVKEDINDAVYTMNVFNDYQLAEKPDLEDGDTFSVTEEAPHYKLRLKEDFIYGEDEYFGNSQGRWVLERV